MKEEFQIEEVVDVQPVSTEELDAEAIVAYEMLPDTMQNGILFRVHLLFLRNICQA